jgi:hypothetical protein
MGCAVYLTFGFNSKYTKHKLIAGGGNERDGRFLPLQCADLKCFHERVKRLQPTDSKSTGVKTSLLNAIAIMQRPKWLDGQFNKHVTNEFRIHGYYLVKGGVIKALDQDPNRAKRQIETHNHEERLRRKGDRLASEFKEMTSRGDYLSGLNVPKLTAPQKHNRGVVIQIGGVSKKLNQWSWTGINERVREYGVTNVNSVFDLERTWSRLPEFIKKGSGSKESRRKYYEFYYTLANFIYNRHEHILPFTELSKTRTQNSNGARGRRAGKRKSQMTLSNVRPRQPPKEGRLSSSHGEVTEGDDVPPKSSKSYSDAARGESNGGGKKGKKDNVPRAAANQDTMRVQAALLNDRVAAISDAQEAKIEEIKAAEEPIIKELGEVDGKWYDKVNVSYSWDTVAGKPYEVVCPKDIVKISWLRWLSQWFLRLLCVMLYYVFFLISPQRAILCLIAFTVTASIRYGLYRLFRVVFKDEYDHYTAKLTIEPRERLMVEPRNPGHSSTVKYISGPRNARIELKRRSDDGNVTIINEFDFGRATVAHIGSSGSDIKKTVQANVAAYNRCRNFGIAETGMSGGLSAANFYYMYEARQLKSVMPGLLGEG